MSIGRRTAIAVMAAMLAPSAATGGDAAERNILGFSPDGAYFAFEEYGIQDGSGFPYSNIYVIETATDSWVHGTPIRVLIEGGAPPLMEARFEAMDGARAVLQQLLIGEPGAVVASNPFTETSADPRSVSFRPRPTLPAVADDHRLRLEEYPLPADDCPDMGQPFVGFRLTLTKPDGQTRVLVEDEYIPISRRCPLGYGISDVVTFFPDPAADPVIVVLINVFSVGFEGPYRRFIAVTAGR